VPTALFCHIFTQRSSNEVIRLEIYFGNHLVFAWGDVVYAVEEMAFALRFIFSEENEARVTKTDRQNAATVV